MVAGFSAQDESTEEDREPRVSQPAHGTAILPSAIALRWHYLARLIVYFYASDGPCRLKDLSPKWIKKHNL